MNEDRKIFIEAIASSPRKTEALIHLNLKRITKNAEFSQKRRNQGNKLFIKKEHDENDHENIFRLYNRSICLAPDGSEELAYAYGNRSALLLHIKMYDNSIQDIDKAIKITRSNNLKLKLLCRKVECLTFLDLLEARRTLEKVKDAFSGIPENGREILHKLISKTESFLNTISQNPVVISKDNYKKEMLMNLNKKEKENVNKQVMIKHNEKYGNHLVASRDIQAGEIIIVEKFYATCLNPKKTFTCCHHCLNFCWSGIPCNDCAWVMFCSEECKTMALETYHDIECSLIPYLKSHCEDLLFGAPHISIHILIKAIKEAGSISKLRAQLNVIDKTNIKEPLKNINFEKKFSTVYSLLKTDIVLDDYGVYSFIAQVFMVFLAKYTSIFGENFKFNKLSDLIENEDFLFVGSLFTKIFKMGLINTYIISSTKQTEKCNHSGNDFICEQELCCTRGNGLTILCSFINHSCDPNVRRCFTDDHRIIIVAKQHIKKNSQIFDSYGSLYFEEHKIERQKFLNDYGFTCDCKACKGNWPAYFKNMEKDGMINYVKNTIGLDRQTLKILTIFTRLRNPDYKCDHKTLQELLKILKEASKNFSEPSMIICLIYTCLNLALESMYGFDKDVFGQCRV